MNSFMPIEKSKNSILETERLYLREMVSNDALSIFELNKDWDVIKYTGDSAFKSVEEARQFLENYPSYRRYGFGRWAVILKENDEFLGWCGIKFHEEKNIYDIGYRFLKIHWGKGYATESAKACLQYGFNHLKLSELTGSAHPENEASIHILKKLGMTYSRTYMEDGQPWVEYIIKK